MKEAVGSRARRLRLVHSRPLTVQNGLPKSFLMFRGGGMAEPIRPLLPRGVLSENRASVRRKEFMASAFEANTHCASKSRELGQEPAKLSVSQTRPAAPPLNNVTEMRGAEEESTGGEAKNLGIAIAAAIMALREFALKSKGLRFKSEGKYKQNWLLSWFWWYDYVRAMRKTVWAAASNMLAKLSAKARSEEATAPFM
jgi:hypothetical protein